MYTFTPVTVEIAVATGEAWIQQLMTGVLTPVPPSAYLMKLDWAIKCANGQCPPNNYVYALVRDTEPNIACALLNVSYAMPNTDHAWLKVLSIQVEPKLDASNTPSVKELSNIASTALIEALGLTFTYPCNTLKVFGTTPLTVEFFEVVAGNLGGIDALEVEIHGNWLVLHK